MKIFLDDVRPCPHDWTLAKNYKECIDFLKTGNVTHLSLDHDLGDDENGTGYDVVCWIEVETALNDFSPPILTIHSANPFGRKRMSSAIERIETLQTEKKNKKQI